MILAFWFIIWKIIEFQVCWREYKFVGERFVGDNTNKGAKFVGANTSLLVTTPTKAQSLLVKGLLVITPTKAQRLLNCKFVGANTSLLVTTPTKAQISIDPPFSRRV